MVGCSRPLRARDHWHFGSPSQRSRRLSGSPLGSGWETLAQLRSCSQAAILCISSATMSLLTSTLSAKAYFSFQLGQGFGGRRSGRQLIANLNCLLIFLARRHIHGKILECKAHVLDTFKRSFYV